ncbi:MAG: aminopeptidase P family protein, partial [Rhodobacteraceae bacterium]|nr:aminopeptidase P family protein [Paracoccaceae bacterium]
MTELSVFKDDRKRTFLNADGADKPIKSPLAQDVLDRARAYRLRRLRDEMARQDVAGLLLYDPVNIRYAFDCSNMSIWTAHNPIRYALILNGGPGIMFEFKACEHLNDGLPGIDEVRTAIGWMFMCAGDQAESRLAPWADEIAGLVREYGGGNMRLGVDRMEPEGVPALSSRGIDIVDGGQITEIARSVKSADEIALMRWTIRVCEAGMARIYDHSIPGATEQELWAHLHFENARSGGEWLETKLLTCGPNTNPWYNECSARECLEGEMISFDTDMIGPYCYCADLS